MTDTLYRVVRTVDTASGPKTLASDPIPRDVAMARFDEMVGWRMDRVRVLRDEDYRASEAS